MQEYYDLQRVFGCFSIISRQIYNFSKKPMMPGIVRLIKSERSPSVLIETVLFLNHHLLICKSMLRYDITPSCNGLVQDILSGECNLRSILNRILISCVYLCQGLPVLKRATYTADCGELEDILTAVMWILTAGVTVKGCSSESVVNTWLNAHGDWFDVGMQNWVGVLLFLSPFVTKQLLSSARQDFSSLV